MTVPVWFKDTELGPIPQKWEVLKLGEVSKFSQWLQVDLDKQYLKKAKWLERFIRIVDFTKQGEEPPRYIIGDQKYLVEGDDIVMIRYGSQTAWKAVRWYAWMIANNMFKISLLDERYDKNFLFLYLSSDAIYNKLRWGQNSTTMPALTFWHVGKLQVPLPPLPEQKAIASVLSSLDDKIELLRDQNKTLENIGQALFKNWFVDFEPWKDDLVESEMGMIPRGWRVGTLGDIATVKSGFAFKSKDFSEEGTNVIKIKNITNAWVDLVNSDFVDEKNLPDRAFDFELSEWDILVAMSWNTTWKISMMPKFDWKFLLNQRAGKFFLDNLEDTWFLYFFLKAMNIWDLILQTAYGSAQPNISWKDIANFDILLPSENIIEDFKKLSNSYINKINTNIYQIQTLSDTRDSLLPRLMNGKVRVV